MIHLMNRYTVGTAVALSIGAIAGGMGYRTGTCKNDSPPEGATAVVQGGKNGGTAPCPIWLSKNDAGEHVSGGYFRRYLGGIEDTGIGFDQIDYLKGSTRHDGRLYTRRGAFQAGHTHPGGAVKDSYDNAKLAQITNLEGLDLEKLNTYDKIRKFVDDPENNHTNHVSKKEHQALGLWALA